MHVRSVEGMTIENICSTKTERYKEAICAEENVKCDSGKTIYFYLKNCCTDLFGITNIITKILFMVISIPLNDKGNDMCPIMYLAVI